MSAAARGEDSRPQLVADVGHAGSVKAMVYSPDGKSLLTASADHSTLVWEPATGRELLRLEGHFSDVQAVACSPDGTRAVTASDDATIRFWNLRSGEQLFRLHDLSEPATALAWTPDGKQVVAACRDGNAYLWNVETREQVRTFAGHTAPVVDLALTPDGKTLVTGSWDSTAIVWDLKSGDKRQRLEHPSVVETVAVSADGRQVLTGSTDKIARLWQTADGTLARSFAGHDDGILAADFVPGGKQIVTAGLDGTARLWLIDTGRELHKWLADGEPVEALACAPDGRRVAVAGGDAVVRIFNTGDGSEVSRLGGMAGVAVVALSKDGKLLVTGGGGLQPTVRVWNPLDCAHVRLLQGHTSDVVSVAIADDGQHILTGSRDRTARIWNVSDGRQLHCLEGHNYGVTAVALSPDGRLAATAGGQRDSVIHLWTVATGKEIRQWEAHSFQLSAIHFSPDGKTLVSTGWDQKANLWESETGNLLHALEHGGFVTSAAWLPDGKQVVTGSTDKRVRIWSAVDGVLLHTLEGHSDGVLSVACSRDGKKLLSGGERVALVWDLETFQDLRNLDRDTSNFDSVSFSAGVKVAATTGRDRLTHLWDITTGRQLCRLISFHDGTWAVVDPQGRFDASNAGDIGHLHWRIGDELVALDQLKERYYDPGLLAKYLGTSGEALREVQQLEAPKLFPQVAVRRTSQLEPKYSVTLNNRAGGIGRLAVWINGKEFDLDARPDGADPNAPALTVPLDFTGDRRLMPGVPNRVEIRAYNGENYLASRGMEVVFTPVGKSSATAPALWGVVAGISDYRGEKLDLTFAAKDAEDFATALGVAGRRMFGPKNVRLTVLSTGDAARQPPVKANIEQALTAARQARPTDVLVIYLAGHGVSHGGQDEDYYFLTSDCQTSDLQDPEVRRRDAISSSELTRWLTAIPANKQVLILDTCAAGRLIQKITENRAVPSSQVRALERTKDRAGVHVLAGCAADRVSYETSRFGQGLLTYSLLMGMRGGKLREGQFVDVIELFGYAADKVPELAKDIGGIQRPQVASPKGGTSFDIGQVTADDKPRIPFRSPRPLVLQARFFEKAEFLDVLDLTKEVNERLRMASARGGPAPLVFVDAADFPDAYRLVGQYDVADNKVRVTVNLFQGRVKTTQFETTGTSDDLAELAKQIVATAEKSLAPPAEAGPAEAPPPASPTTVSPTKASPTTVAPPKPAKK
jgi:WD40 repeat protein